MVEMACELFPQLRHHIDYVEFSTPLTNNYYFSQQYVSTFIQDSKRTLHSRVAIYGELCLYPVLIWLIQNNGPFQGETYGLDNNKARFDDPWLFAKLRPETDVPGLYLTGRQSQSIFVP